MFHLTIDLITLIASILIGFFITFKKGAVDFYFKLIPYFLSTTLLVELTGQYFQKRGLTNVSIYNIYAVIEFGFFTYFFGQVIPNLKIRRTISLYGFALPAICLANILFGQGLHVFNTYTFMTGGLIMILFGITYFYQLFKSTNTVNLLQEPPFWISIGIIFFFTCSVSLIGSYNYISALPKIILSNMNQILLLVDAFFYLMFIIAFLCQINTRKSSPSL